MCVVWTHQWEWYMFLVDVGGIYVCRCYYMDGIGWGGGGGGVNPVTPQDKVKRNNHIKPSASHTSQITVCRQLYLSHTYITHVSNNNMINSYQY